MGGHVISDGQPLASVAFLDAWDRWFIREASRTLPEQWRTGHLVRVPQGHPSTQWRAVQVRRVGN